MIIILEGPDNSGKTTLALAIQKKYGCVLKKSPGPLPGVDLYKWCNHWLKFAHQHWMELDGVIFDRFPYFSELVYGPILRNKIVFTGDQILTLKDQLTLIDPLIVFCYTYADDINSHPKPQMDGVIQHYELIWRGYKDLFNSETQPGSWTARYNYKDFDSVKETLRRIDSYVKFKRDEYIGVAYHEHKRYL